MNECKPLRGGKSKLDKKGSKSKPDNNSRLSSLSKKAIVGWCRLKPGETRRESAVVS